MQRMNLIAVWSDTRASRDKVTYRLSGNHDQFVLERREEDAQGGDRWTEVERFDRLGPKASVLALLAIGLEDVDRRLKAQDSVARSRNLEFGSHP